MESISENQSNGTKIQEEKLLDIPEEKSLESKNNDLHVVDDLPEMKEYSGKTITIEIAAGAILGGLSVLLSFTWDAYVESLIGSVIFAPGMTWFDVIAVPILIAFFVFSIRSGLIAAVIGCGSIAFYLSEPYGWLAMQPKFVASVSMFLVPWIFLKIVNIRHKKTGKETWFSKKFGFSSETFNPIVNYIILMRLQNLLKKHLPIFHLELMIIRLNLNNTQFSIKQEIISLIIDKLFGQSKKRKKKKVCINNVLN